MDINKVLIDPLLFTRIEFDTAERFYEGRQGEVFAYPHMEQHFSSDYYSRHTILNFMRPVVDNVVNRLEIANVVGSSQQVNKAVDKIRDNNRMELLEKEVHRKVSSLGEAFVMVWVNPISKEPLISLADPRDTIIIYNQENPTEKLVGARVWYDQLNGGHKLNVFYPDRIEKYVTPSEELSAGTNWNLVEVLDNPFGEVPLFHFRPHGNTGRVHPHYMARRYIDRPEHYDGYHIQNAINKLTITHMITVDYQGAPQRWALKDPNAEGMEIEDFVEDETQREETGLKNSPGDLWTLNGYKAVGQFAAALPNTFTDPIDHYVMSLAATTNTPIHYFQQNGRPPTSDGARAVEAPLLKKVADRQLSYGETWEDVYSFAVKVELDVTKDIEIEILWQSVESIDILEIWDVQAKKANTGVPFRQRMKEVGYDDQTIDQMIQWKQEEQNQLGNQYQRAANTNPDVRTNINHNENNPAPTQQQDPGQQQ